MAAKVESKPVAWLKPDPDQPRKMFDEEHLRLLGASLLKKQWYALLVRPTGMILDGECRWRAAKLVGKEMLDVIILDESISRAEATELQLVTALHRAALSPFEQASGFRDWLAGNAGQTAKELAARIDRDPSLITRYVSIFDCIQPVQDAAAASRIGPSQWYPISQLPLADQGELLEMHLAGVPRDQLAEACRKKRAKAVMNPAVKLSRVKCPLSTGTTVVVSGPEMSLEDLISALSQALEAARKANKDGLDIKTLSAVMRDKAKAV
jgi:ParB/RepB/Spo0J family partition protein